jgi:hypothetical protein
VKKLLTACLLLAAACRQMESTPVRIPPTRPPTRTPPGPATATSAPVPTSTFSPTPLPRFFTEEFDGQIPDWSVLQINSDVPPHTQIRDGALRIELDAPFSWSYAIVGARAYADVRIDARVQSRASTPEAVGVMCRYSEASGWYEFNVSGDRTYNVLYGQWLADGVARYTPIAFDESEYLNPSGADNEIGLACQGTTLWLYINGKLFRKLNETRFALTEGRVGLSIAAFENTPVVAAFDWVRVSEPEAQ